MLLVNKKEVINIKDKKVSSNEVTNAYVERSKKSKNLNAYNEETFDEALKKSKEFDSKPDFNKKMSFSSFYDYKPSLYLYLNQ